MALLMIFFSDQHRNGEYNQKFWKNWLRGITQAYDVPKLFRILLLFTQKLPI